MADKEYEVVDVDSYPSPDRKSTPLRPVYCLKNRDQIKKTEGKEECFILDFDPYDDSEKSRFPLREDFDNADSDLHVVAERGQVACRDYPHPRHNCAKFHFEKTPHDSYCKLCYCYVCDVSAPCSKWVGSSGHCHAFNNEAWDQEKKAWRIEKAKVV
ncbi:hypothetical protein PHJA_001017800 [Phtheirospermum japonicum]|uniref:RPM1 interacting protein 13 n=1 Tax=Phtheirospermum japonicum TaxID=374723 RepID=A0A830C394_9LAMI|nr:hypothetical protein PHJA_001017800 [Phtheirospermum japonicum]